MENLIDILPVSVLILFFFNAHLCKPLNRINRDYLSLETTKCFRGLFALVIVFHHLSKTTDSGMIFPHFFSVGYLAVAAFFFFSGYGLQKSYIEKSERYKKGFLLKRIPGVLLPYIVFTIVYWGANLINGTVYTLADIFKGLINGHPIVSYSWYIICILLFYLFFWLFMMICNKHYNRIILYGCIWCVLWALFCIKMNYDSWWFNASHLLVIGIVWATYEKSIIRFIEQRYCITAAFVVICFAVLFLFRERIPTIFPIQHASTLLSLVTAVIFVCCVLLLSMRIKSGNRIFDFLGEISLEIYLIHGLIIKQTAIQNDLIRCTVVLLLTVSLSFVFHIVFSSVLKKYRSMISKAIT